jgi:hypothetical protein
MSSRAVTVGVSDRQTSFAVTKPVDSERGDQCRQRERCDRNVVGITASAAMQTAPPTPDLQPDQQRWRKFAIDAATGVVTVAGAIDRELDASLTSRCAPPARRLDRRQGSRSRSTTSTSLRSRTPADTQRDGQRRQLRTLLWARGGVTAFASDARATTNAVPTA